MYCSKLYELKEPGVSGGRDNGVNGVSGVSGVNGDVGECSIMPPELGD